MRDVQYTQMAARFLSQSRRHVCSANHHENQQLELRIKEKADDQVDYPCSPKAASLFLKVEA